MALPLPATLSPSKVGSFTDCALAFRLSVIDRLPEPPSLAACRGTLVHRALERLFWDTPAGRRSLPVALAQLQAAWQELRGDEEFAALCLDGPGEATLLEDAAQLVTNYFALEDPDAVRVIGVEMLLEARVGGVRLRGIIDRLELDAQGELVVTDYKTGRAPGVVHEQRRLGGVNFYALLCEQVLGRRPARIQLLHLRDPLAIVASPSEQSLKAVATRTAAVWSAVVRACEQEDFRPRPSALCQTCSYKQFCPAFGGDVEQAARLALASA